MKVSSRLSFSLLKRIRRKKSKIPRASIPLDRLLHHPVLRFKYLLGRLSLSLRALPDPLCASLPYETFETEGTWCESSGSQPVPSNISGEMGWWWEENQQEEEEEGGDCKTGRNMRRGRMPRDTSDEHRLRALIIAKLSHIIGPLLTGRSIPSTYERTESDEEPTFHFNTRLNNSNRCQERA